MTEAIGHTAKILREIWGGRGDYPADLLIAQRLSVCLQTEAARAIMRRQGVEDTEAEPSGTGWDVGDEEAIWGMSETTQSTKDPGSETDISDDESDIDRRSANDNQPEEGVRGRAGPVRGGPATPGPPAGR